LMANHAHLLLRTGMVPRSAVMRRLLTGYAQMFTADTDDPGSFS
jgi:hypothetical protein